MILIINVLHEITFLNNGYPVFEVNVLKCKNNISFLFFLKKMQENLIK